MDHPHLDVALITLGDPGRLTGGYLYHRRMAALAPEHGARIRFVSVSDGPFPLPALPARGAVRTASSAAAVVVDSIAAAFVAPWLLTTGRVPVVASIHQRPGGIDHGPVRTALQAPFDRMAYRRARILIVASESLADRFAEEAFATERIRVVPPGRDVAQAPPGERQDLRRDRDLALLCVANWIPRKDIVSLLDALARLPAGTATLHLAGDDRTGPYADRVRERLAAPSLADRVVVHGPVPPERVAALYRDADAFVLPSLEEPYGTVYGEAMAAGLPVLGWRAGNLPHLARDAREGLLVEPHDVDGLARAIATLARDASLRQRLGDAARQTAARWPTWKQSAGMFFAALREAVAAQ